MIPDSTRTCLEGVLRVRKISEVSAEVGLAGGEGHGECICGLCGAFNFISVVAIAGCQYAEQLVIEKMLPFDGCISVPIIVSGVTVQFKIIFALIRRYIDIVVVVYLMTDGGSNMIKGSIAIFEFF